MTFHFSLVDEPWIMVQQIGQKEPAQMGLRQFLQQVPTIMGLADHALYVIVGTHRWLVAILQAIYRLALYEQIGDLRLAGFLDLQKIDDFFNCELDYSKSKIKK